MEKEQRGCESNRSRGPGPLRTAYRTHYRRTDHARACFFDARR
jgi:hypothetical protein